MVELKYLNFDSEFFGFKIARLEDDGSLTEEGLKKLIDDNKDLKLIYFITNNSNLAQNFNAKHVDDKTTYVMRLEEDKFEIDKYVKEYTKTKPNRELNRLAIVSGLHSRFMTDKNFPRGMGNKLYLEWIKNSVNKKMADAVLTYNLENMYWGMNKKGKEIHKSMICGMVTVGHKNNIGDIGLVSVFSDCRGAGVGTVLVNSAQKWFWDNGYKEIQVVTQGCNVAAKRLYEKCGFKIEKIEPFYHLWL